jgi:predicted patatin/cPLA2 family phospholipase
LESKTSKSFDEKSKDLVDRYSQETNYVELPEMILENMIIPNEFIHSKAKEEYSRNDVNKDYFALACKEYATYKKSAEKEVSYLVKEFECKKSADQYARASTARTGVLDTQKLHTYKFNEDLFKKLCGP